MSLTELQQKTSQIFRTNGVSRASVFRSVSRGTENLKRDVDVITEEGLNERLKPRIAEDIKLIYEG